MPRRSRSPQRRWGLAGLALCGLLATAGAGATEPASGTLYVRLGEEGLRAVVEIAIEPGWILYHTQVGGDPDERGKGYPGRPLVVSPSGAGLVFAPARFPPPRRHDDPLLHNWAWAHAGRIRIYLAAAPVAGGPPPGILPDLRVALSGSTCSDEGVCRRYEETLAPAGPGPDALFAGFPTDLHAPARR
jgi:DsbC/DsbD-like thiol-disulfide interchange protein